MNKLPNDLSASFDSSDSSSSYVTDAESDGEEIIDEIGTESEDELEGDDSLITYGIKITRKAEEQLQRYLEYLIYKKKNMQAAVAVSKDFDETVDSLTNLAGVLRLCEDEDLRRRGIKKIFLKRHDYVLLYRIVKYDGNAVAVIEAVYHTLQDYENLFKREE